VTISAHIIYAMAWLGFGAAHSLLAGPTAKAVLHPLLGRSYRLVYNIFALFTIGIVIYGTRYGLDGALGPFELTPALRQVLSGITVLGALIFVAALSQYDLGRFAGVTQLFEPANEQSLEKLHLSGLHRFVRHPLYTGAHLYFWGSVRSEFDLATAVWASAYFIIGSHFEEQKLIADFGDAYRHYKTQVPSVIPWRGRAIWLSIKQRGIL